MCQFSQLVWSVGRTPSAAWPAPTSWMWVTSLAPTVAAAQRRPSPPRPWQQSRPIPLLAAMVVFAGAKTMTDRARSCWTVRRRATPPSTPGVGSDAAPLAWTPATWPRRSGRSSTCRTDGQTTAMWPSEKVCHCTVRVCRTYIHVQRTFKTSSPLFAWLKATSTGPRPFFLVSVTSLGCAKAALTPSCTQTLSFSPISVEGTERLSPVHLSTCFCSGRDGCNQGLLDEAPETAGLLGLVDSETSSHAAGTTGRAVVVYGLLTLTVFISSSVDLSFT